MYVHYIVHANICTPFSRNCDPTTIQTLLDTNLNKAFTLFRFNFYEKWWAASCHMFISRIRQEKARGKRSYFGWLSFPKNWLGTHAPCWQSWVEAEIHTWTMKVTNENEFNNRGRKRSRFATIRPTDKTISSEASSSSITPRTAILFTFIFSHPPCFPRYDTHIYFYLVQDGHSRRECHNK